MADSTALAERWRLGAVNPKKVIHRYGCQHGHTDYMWAQHYPDVESLAAALVENRSDGWHRACRVCCADLESAITAACVRRRVAAGAVTNRWRSLAGDMWNELDNLRDLWTGTDREVHVLMLIEAYEEAEGMR